MIDFIFDKFIKKKKFSTAFFFFLCWLLDDISTYRIEEIEIWAKHSRTVPRVSNSKNAPHGNFLFVLDCSESDPIDRRFFFQWSKLRLAYEDQYCKLCYFFVHCCTKMKTKEWNQKKKKHTVRKKRNNFVGTNPIDFCFRSIPGVFYWRPFFFFFCSDFFRYAKTIHMFVLKKQNSLK